MEFFISHLLFINRNLLHSLPVQADMLSACLEYEDILSDKHQGAHPNPPNGREPDTHPLPLPKGGGQGTSTYTFRRICYPPEQKEPGIRGALSPLPWGGVGGGCQTPSLWEGWGGLLVVCRIIYPHTPCRRIAYPPERVGGERIVSLQCAQRLCGAKKQWFIWLFGF